MHHPRHPALTPNLSLTGRGEPEKISKEKTSGQTLGNLVSPILEEELTP